MIRLFLLAFLLPSTAFGQQCSADDFKKFNTCFVSTLNNLQTDGLNDQVQQKVHQCLVDGKCVSENEALSNDSTISRFFGNVDPVKFRQCQNQLTSPLVDNIEMCVQQTFTGFSMMKFNDFDGQQFTRSDDLVKKFMNSLSKCDPQTLPTVLKCTTTVFGGANSSFSTFCNNTKGCLKNLPCKYELDVKPVVCRCTRDHLNSATGSASKYENDFSDCLGKKRPNLRKKLDLTIFINQLISELCDNDLCSKMTGM